MQRTRVFAFKLRERPCADIAGSLVTGSDRKETGRKLKQALGGYTGASWC